MADLVSQNLPIDMDTLEPDPFNPTFEALCAINSFTEFTIPLHFAGKPHALCRTLMGNRPDWWFILMLFNGVTSHHELQPGVTLRIPEQRLVSDILGRKLNDVTYDNDTLEI